MATERVPAAWGPRVLERGVRDLDAELASSVRLWCRTRRPASGDQPWVRTAERLAARSEHSPRPPARPGFAAHSLAMPAQRPMHVQACGGPDITTPEGVTYLRALAMGNHRFGDYWPRHPNDAFLARMRRPRRFRRIRHVPVRVLHGVLSAVGGAAILAAQSAILAAYF